MHVAKTPEHVLSFLRHIVASSGFQLTNVLFQDQDQWNYADGVIAHKTGGFFHVVGIESAQNQAEHVMLYQPQSALTGLAIYLDGEDPYVLIQARVEPGNVGVGQYGPTIQSTPANFLKTHQGADAPYLGLFYAHDQDLLASSASMQMDLGKLYFQKSKWSNYALTREMLHTESEIMVWVRLHALVELASTDHILNADLRSILAIFDWDGLLAPKERRADPIPVLSDLIALRTLPGFPYRFKPLATLRDWQVIESGVKSRHAQGIDVGLFHVSCNHREVAQWVQPMVSAKSDGLVLLLCRAADNGWEYLLSLEEAPGLQGGLAIAPTYMAYPGETVHPDYLEVGVTRFEFAVSDEGGRFFQHVSTYRICAVEADYPAGTNQYWVCRDTLKALLGTSNMLSIQLRSMCSVLLPELNPLMFARFKA